MTFCLLLEIFLLLYSLIKKGTWTRVTNIIPNIKTFKIYIGHPWFIFRYGNPSIGGLLEKKKLVYKWFTGSLNKLLIQIEHINKEVKIMLVFTYDLKLISTSLDSGMYNPNAIKNAWYKKYW